MNPTICVCIFWSESMNGRSSSVAGRISILSNPLARYAGRGMG
jgi:hypothetical protein